MQKLLGITGDPTGTWHRTEVARLACHLALKCDQDVFVDGIWLEEHILLGTDLLDPSFCTQFQCIL